MKLSDGLTKLIPSILIFVFYGICFSVFAIVIKKIDLSVAYAIWSGMGTLVIVFIGVGKNSNNFNQTSFTSQPRSTWG
jgi:small multidrug resistance pump